MDDKQRKQLMETLKNAIDVETETVTQEQMVEQCTRIWMERKPVLQLEKEISQKIKKVNTKYNSDEQTSAITSGVVGVVFLFMFIVCLGVEPVIAWIIFAIDLICGIYFLYVINTHRKRVNDEKRVYDYTVSNNNSENERIRKENEARKNAYHTEFAEWKQSYIDFFTKLKTLQTRTGATLTHVYKTDAIYPKYRNLPALTSIYEYFVTGRCDELTGPHGAYNMYEDELRKDTVISQLNTVIDNLEQIKNSQYMLYQQVSAIKRDIYSVTSELQAIKGYTLVTAQMSALNAYYSAVTASNTRISAACDLLE